MNPTETFSNRANFTVHRILSKLGRIQRTEESPSTKKKITKKSFPALNAIHSRFAH
jgi:hypothetical protein